MINPPVEDFATDFDHTDEAWVADPYPIMDDLRERCPVAHSDRYGGLWAPMTYDAVAAIANDTEHFTSRTVVINNGRPGDDALPRRHERDRPFGAFPERIEIRDRIAQAKQSQPREILPALLDLAQDHLPRDPAKWGAVEGFQVDDIQLHDYEWTLIATQP